MLMFPYFNESHVLEAFPSFVMMDYQVKYVESFIIHSILTTLNFIMYTAVVGPH